MKFRTENICITSNSISVFVKSMSPEQLLLSFKWKRDPGGKGWWEGGGVGERGMTKSSSMRYFL